MPQQRREHSNLSRRKRDTGGMSGEITCWVLLQKTMVYINWSQEEGVRISSSEKRNYHPRRKEGYSWMIEGQFNANGKRKVNERKNFEERRQERQTSRGRREWPTISEPLGKESTKASRGGRATTFKWERNTPMHVAGAIVPR